MSPLCKPHNLPSFCVTLCEIGELMTQSVVVQGGVGGADRSLLASAVVVTRLASLHLRHILPVAVWRLRLIRTGHIF